MGRRLILTSKPSQEECCCSIVHLTMKFSLPKALSRQRRATALSRLGASAVSGWRTGSFTSSNRQNGYRRGYVSNTRNVRADTNPHQHGNERDKFETLRGLRIVSRAAHDVNTEFPWRITPFVCGQCRHLSIVHNSGAASHQRGFFFCPA